MGQPLKKQPESHSAAPSLKVVTQSHPASWISEWNIEDPKFWETQGKAIANKNLMISTAALMLAFVVWMVWSTVVVELPNVGFKFSTDQLFWLAALPSLSGAILRVFYSFMVPIFGGKNWTALTTASLAIPMVGIGYAVQNPETPYFFFVLLALLCGFGGGNFASSMGNISFFFPKAKKGTALGINGGLGNLGVSVVQFFSPIVIATSIYGSLGGAPQNWVNAAGATKQIWLQNTAWVWVPFILAITVWAWKGMDNLAAASSSFKDQTLIFKRKHNWLAGILYTGSFGSFIGYSAALPLLIKTEFPTVIALKYAFLGPLIGGLSRSAGGWISDRFGGSKVTLFAFSVMGASVFGVLHFLAAKDSPDAFTGFLASFIVLFCMSGIANASIYRMVPVVFSKLQPETATKESAAVLGFISALAALGGFIVPKSFGFAISAYGSVEPAFLGFVSYYCLCLGVVWWYYARKNAEARC
jgi:NNP family nitrate/nitrite transporter-like MFS transporter